MGLLLESPISAARVILNDEAGERYTDPQLLQYANDALDVAVTLAPQLFYADGEVTCIPLMVMQAVSYDDAVGLIDVRRIKTGKAITRVDRKTMDAFDPDWPLTAPAAAVHWMPVGNDPMRFLIWPPAPDTEQILECTFVRNPPEYAADADTGLPAMLSDAITDYIVHRAESRDDEHVNSNRAAQFLNSFVQKLKGA